GPGRPLGSHKTATTIRLDDDVLDAFKATGRGWQTRVNAVLKEWLKTHKPA
ncbi:BrnA antitoxin family protein, partial [Burkholderia pseudomallei]